jgi:hypothetical protein
MRPGDFFPSIAEIRASARLLRRPNGLLIHILEALSVINLQQLEKRR